jgi:hypothetical protein
MPTGRPGGRLPRNSAPSLAPELRRLHQAVLNHEPALAVNAGRVAAPRKRTSNLPVRTTFTGAH